MSNFFKRMADRTLGLVPLVDPAPQSHVPGADEREGTREEADRFWSDVAALGDREVENEPLIDHPDPDFHEPVHEDDREEEAYQNQDIEQEYIDEDYGDHYHDVIESDEDASRSSLADGTDRSHDVILEDQDPVHFPEPHDPSPFEESWPLDDVLVEAPGYEKEFIREPGDRKRLSRRHRSGEPAKTEQEGAPFDHNGNEGIDPTQSSKPEEVRVSEAETMAPSQPMVPDVESPRDQQVETEQHGPFQESAASQSTPSPQAAPKENKQETPEERQGADFRNTRRSHSPTGDGETEQVKPFQDIAASQTDATQPPTSKETRHETREVTKRAEFGEQEFIEPSSDDKDPQIFRSPKAPRSATQSRKHEPRSRTESRSALNPEPPSLDKGPSHSHPDPSSNPSLPKKLIEEKPNRPTRGSEQDYLQKNREATRKTQALESKPSSKPELASPSADRSANLKKPDHNRVDPSQSASPVNRADSIQPKRTAQDPAKSEKQNTGAPNSQAPAGRPMGERQNTANLKNPQSHPTKQEARKPQPSPTPDQTRSVTWQHDASPVNPRQEDRLDRLRNEDKAQHKSSVSKPPKTVDGYLSDSTRDVVKNQDISSSPSAEIRRSQPRENLKNDALAMGKSGPDQQISAKPNLRGQDPTTNAELPRRQPQKQRHDEHRKTETPGKLSSQSRIQPESVASERASHLQPSPLAQNPQAIRGAGQPAQNEAGANQNPSPQPRTPHSREARSSNETALQPKGHQQEKGRAGFESERDARVQTTGNELHRASTEEPDRKAPEPSGQTGSRQTSQPAQKTKYSQRYPETPQKASSQKSLEPENVGRDRTSHRQPSPLSQTPHAKRDANQPAQQEAVAKQDRNLQPPLDKPHATAGDARSSVETVFQPTSQQPTKARTEFETRKDAKVQRPGNEPHSASTRKPVGEQPERSRQTEPSKLSQPARKAEPSWPDTTSNTQRADFQQTSSQLTGQKKTRGDNASDLVHARKQLISPEISPDTGQQTPESNRGRVVQNERGLQETQAQVANPPKSAVEKENLAPRNETDSKARVHDSKSLDPSIPDTIRNDAQPGPQVQIPKSSVQAGRDAREDLSERAMLSPTSRETSKVKPKVEDHRRAASQPTTTAKGQSFAARPDVESENAATHQAKSIAQSESSISKVVGAHDPIRKAPERKSGHDQIRQSKPPLSSSTQQVNFESRTLPEKSSDDKSTNRPANHQQSSSSTIDHRSEKVAQSTSPQDDTVQVRPTDYRTERDIAGPSETFAPQLKPGSRNTPAGNPRNLQSTRDQLHSETARDIPDFTRRNAETPEPSAQTRPPFQPKKNVPFPQSPAQASRPTTQDSHPEGSRPEQQNHPAAKEPVNPKERANQESKTLSPDSKAQTRQNQVISQRAPHSQMAEHEAELSSNKPQSSPKRPSVKNNVEPQQNTKNQLIPGQKTAENIPVQKGPTAPAIDVNPGAEITNRVKPGAPQLSQRTPGRLAPNQPKLERKPDQVKAQKWRAEETPQQEQRKTSQPSPQFKSPSPTQQPEKAEITGNPQDLAPRPPTQTPAAKPTSSSTHGVPKEAINQEMRTRVKVTRDLHSDPLMEAGSGLKNHGKDIRIPRSLSNDPNPGIASTTPAKILPDTRTEATLGSTPSKNQNQQHTSNRAQKDPSEAERHPNLPKMGKEKRTQDATRNPRVVETRSDQHPSADELPPKSIKQNAFTSVAKPVNIEQSPEAPHHRKPVFNRPDQPGDMPAIKGQNPIIASPLTVPPKHSAVEAPGQAEIRQIKSERPTKPSDSLSSEKAKNRTISTPSSNTGQHAISARLRPDTPQSNREERPDFFAKRNSNSDSQASAPEAASAQKVEAPNQVKNGQPKSDHLTTSPNSLASETTRNQSTSTTSSNTGQHTISTRRHQDAPQNTREGTPGIRANRQSKLDSQASVNEAVSAQKVQKPLLSKTFVDQASPIRPVPETRKDRLIHPEATKQKDAKVPESRRGQLKENQRDQGHAKHFHDRVADSSVVDLENKDSEAKFQPPKISSKFIDSKEIKPASRNTAPENTAISQTGKPKPVTKLAVRRSLNRALKETGSIPLAKSSRREQQKAEAAKPRNQSYQPSPNQEKTSTTTSQRDSLKRENRSVAQKQGTTQSRSNGHPNPTYQGESQSLEKEGVRVRHPGISPATKPRSFPAQTPAPNPTVQRDVLANPSPIDTNSPIKTHADESLPRTTSQKEAVSQNYNLREGKRAVEVNTSEPTKRVGYPASELGFKPKADSITTRTPQAPLSKTDNKISHKASFTKANREEEESGIFSKTLPETVQVQKTTGPRFDLPKPQSQGEPFREKTQKLQKTSNMSRTKPEETQDSSPQRGDDRQSQNRDAGILKKETPVNPASLSPNPEKQRRSEEQATPRPSTNSRSSFSQEIRVKKAQKEAPEQNTPTLATPLISSKRQQLALGQLKESELLKAKSFTPPGHLENKAIKRTGTGRPSSSEPKSTTIPTAQSQPEKAPARQARPINEKAPEWKTSNLTASKPIRDNSAASAMNSNKETSAQPQSAQTKPAKRRTLGRRRLKAAQISAPQAGIPFDSSPTASAKVSHPVAKTPLTTKARPATLIKTDKATESPVFKGAEPQHPDRLTSERPDRSSSLVKPSLATSPARQRPKTSHPQMEAQRNKSENPSTIKNKAVELETPIPKTESEQPTTRIGKPHFPNRPSPQRPSTEVKPPTSSNSRNALERLAGVETRHTETRSTGLAARSTQSPFSEKPISIRPSEERETPKKSITTGVKGSLNKQDHVERTSAVQKDPHRPSIEVKPPTSSNSRNAQERLARVETRSTETRSTQPPFSEKPISIRPSEERETPKKSIPTGVKGSLNKQDHVKRTGAVQKDLQHGLGNAAQASRSTRGGLPHQPNNTSPSHGSRPLRETTAKRDFKPTPDSLKDGLTKTSRQFEPNQPFPSLRMEKAERVRRNPLSAARSTRQTLNMELQRGEKGRDKFLKPMPDPKPLDSLAPAPPQKPGMDSPDKRPGPARQITTLASRQTASNLEAKPIKVEDRSGSRQPKRSAPIWANRTPNHQQTTSPTTKDSGQVKAENVGKQRVPSLSKRGFNQVPIQDKTDTGISADARGRRPGQAQRNSDQRPSPIQSSLNMTPKTPLSRSTAFEKAERPRSRKLAARRISQTAPPDMSKPIVGQAERKGALAPTTHASPKAPPQSAAQVHRNPLIRPAQQSPTMAKPQPEGFRSAPLVGKSIGQHDQQSPKTLLPQNRRPDGEKTQAQLLTKREKAIPEVAGSPTKSPSRGMDPVSAPPGSLQPTPIELDRQREARRGRIPKSSSETSDAAAPIRTQAERRRAVREGWHRVEPKKIKTGQPRDSGKRGQTKKVEMPTEAQPVDRNTLFNFSRVSLPPTVVRPTPLIPDDAPEPSQKQALLHPFKSKSDLYQGWLGGAFPTPIGTNAPSTPARDLQRPMIPSTPASSPIVQRAAMESSDPVRSNTQKAENPQTTPGRLTQPAKTVNRDQTEETHSIPLFPKHMREKRRTPTHRRGPSPEPIGQDIADFPLFTRQEPQGHQPDDPFSKAVSTADRELTRNEKRARSGELAVKIGTVKVSARKPPPKPKRERVVYLSPSKSLEKFLAEH